jgi:hypothetical protein
MLSLTVLPLLPSSLSEPAKSRISITAWAGCWDRKKRLQCKAFAAMPLDF